jgi:hypothetical protein
MKKIAISLCLLCSSTYLLAQAGIATKEAYTQAFSNLKNMLSGKDSIDYERAVFISENAYYNNALDYSDFKHVLDYHTKMITLMAENARQENAEKYKTLTGYQKTMFMQNTANWAIFNYITDTTFFETNKMLYSTPYTYSAADPYGTAHWEHTQVINLLVNKTGNCYALAALFKLFSNRLQSDARLTVAPNHIYIENRNAKGDFKNVELATKTFPGDGSIQTLTYTTHELIMNGMAQRSLNDTAAVALNLIYLAKGYEKAFANSTDEFIEHCADVAFKYDTLSLNALLLKAELTENRLFKAMATNKLTTATQSRANLKTQKLLANYEKQLNNLYKLGYREIPANIAQLITAAKQGNSDGYIATNQTPTPFASMGKNQRYATLSWGLFDELHAPQDTITYFRTSFNTKKKKVIAFFEIDTAINYKVDPVVFACSVDPLAHKYPDISPYAFVANSPVRFKDSDGRQIVDANGNVAVYTDGKGVVHFTQYATPDIKTVITAMNKTDIGNQVVQSMVSSCNNIKIVLETGKRGYYDPKTRTSSSEKTEGSIEMFAETKADKLNGEDMPDLTITIFIKTIDDFEKLSPTQVHQETRNGKVIDVSDFKKEDIIGAQGVHEGTHATDKTSNINTNKNSTKAQREAKPEANEAKHYESVDKTKVHSEK